MGVLPDWMIRESCAITPFEEEKKRPGVISYGVSSYGYDIRAGYKFKVFTNVWGSVVDPKKFDPKSFVEVDLTPTHDHSWETVTLRDKVNRGNWCARCGAWKDTPSEKTYQCPEKKPDHILIPPNSFALAETIEHIDVPRDTLLLVIGKSTYARCGIVVNCTPLEPEWRGKITLELSNTTPLPAKVYAGEGIAQVLFLRGEQTCHVSYEDKKGKYQDQTGLTNPKVD